MVAVAAGQVFQQAPNNLALLRSERQARGVGRQAALLADRDSACDPPAIPASVACRRWSGLAGGGGQLQHVAERAGFGKQAAAVFAPFGQIGRRSRCGRGHFVQHLEAAATRPQQPLGGVPEVGRAEIAGADDACWCTICCNSPAVPADTARPGIASAGCGCRSSCGAPTAPGRWPVRWCCSAASASAAIPDRRRASAAGAAGARCRGRCAAP